MKRLGLSAIAVLVLAIGVGVVAATSGSESGPELLTVTPQGNSSVEATREFTEYPVYFAGAPFRDFPLSAVDQTVDRTKGVTFNVRFLYGSCDIPLDENGKADGGCGLPFEIQNWPACRRSFNMDATQGLGADERLTVRGVPAVFNEGYHRLTLATGTTTVVIFGSGRELLLDAAASLRGLNDGTAGALGDLPKPAPGAVEGLKKC
jgi:hypothetical protein